VSNVDGFDCQLGPAVVLAPTFALSSVDLIKKFSSPKEVHISSASSLVVEGKDVEIQSMQLDGALIIKVCEGASLVVRDVVVNNAGWKFEPYTPGNACVWIYTYIYIYVCIYVYITNI
jgi:UDP-sugar pyrophosphorylase